MSFSYISASPVYSSIPEVCRQHGVFHENVPCLIISQPPACCSVMTHCMTDAWTHGSPRLSLPSFVPDHIIILNPLGSGILSLPWLRHSIPVCAMTRIENQCVSLQWGTINRECKKTKKTNGGSPRVVFNVKNLGFRLKFTFQKSR